LRASGWTLDGRTLGGAWSCPSRPRADRHPLGIKSRWVLGQALRAGQPSSRAPSGPPSDSGYHTGPRAAA
jgi:hypothetical protein